MVTDYAKMTLKELEAISRDLAEKKAEIRLEQRKLNAEIAKRTAEELIKKKVGSMSDSEKAAMRQALGPGSTRKK